MLTWDESKRRLNIKNHDNEIVILVYTERPTGTHVISLRKAEKHEARYDRQAAKENLA